MVAHHASCSDQISLKSHGFILKEYNKKELGKCNSRYITAKNKWDCHNQNNMEDRNPVH